MAKLIIPATGEIHVAPAAQADNKSNGAQIGDLLDNLFEQRMYACTKALRDCLCEMIQKLEKTMAEASRG